jgi:succinyl-diaminopimelate desuccinylase
VAKPLKGSVELHFTYDEEFGGEARPRLAAEERPDQARPDDRRRLQLPGGDRPQRLPADGSDGARQDGHAAIPDTGVDALQGAVHILNALYALNAATRRSLQVDGHHPPVPERGPDRGRHQHQRDPRQGGAQAGPPHDPRGKPGEVEASHPRRSSPTAGAARSTRRAAATRIRVDIKRLLLARAMVPLAGNQPLVEAIQKHGEAVFGEPIPPWARRCTPTCGCTWSAASPA